MILEAPSLAPIFICKQSSEIQYITCEQGECDMDTARAGYEVFVDYWSLTFS